MVTEVGNAGLTQDDCTVLLIADQGESLAPIGRWEQPIRKLHALGLLKQNDAVNFVITANGRTALRQEEAKNDQALAGLFQTASAVQSNIQDFAEQAAQLLASAGQASARVTGDAPSVAVDKWAEVLRKRAKELLDARRDAR